jgi:hypothetical protein
MLDYVSFPFRVWRVFVFRSTRSSGCRMGFSCPGIWWPTDVLNRVLVDCDGESYDEYLVWLLSMSL